MSEPTQQFFASGAGTGITSCIRNYQDMLDADSLGGGWGIYPFPGNTYSEKFQNAVWWFWNLKRVNLDTFEIKISGGQEGSFEPERPFLPYFEADPNGPGDIFFNLYLAQVQTFSPRLEFTEPFQRVCWQSRIARVDGPQSDPPSILDPFPVFSFPMRNQDFIEFWVNFSFSIVFNEEGDPCLMARIGGGQNHDWQSDSIIFVEQDEEEVDAYMDIQAGPDEEDIISIGLKGVRVDPEEGSSIRVDEATMQLEFWDYPDPD